VRWRNGLAVGAEAFNVEAGDPAGGRRGGEDERRSGGAHGMKTMAAVLRGVDQDWEVSKPQNPGQQSATSRAGRGAAMATR
jgi:hypothetical protein